MNIESLIREILKQIESSEIGSSKGGKLPKVLVVSMNQSEEDHGEYKLDELGSSFDIVHHKENLDVNLNEYKEILLYGVDSEALHKITRGVFDTDNLRQVGNCIMAGKHITIIEDYMDFYQYKNTMPNQLKLIFEEKLEILKSWGLGVSTEAQAVARLASQEKGNLQSVLSEKKIIKKLVTLEDVLVKENEKKTTMVIGRNTIVTDLARDYAKEKGINILVQDS